MALAADAALAGELEVSLATPAVALSPGGRGAIEVSLANATASDLHGEAQLLSPWGSWQQTRDWTTGFAVAPGERQTLSFGVAMPATARPGEQWWALVKVMYFGRVVYSEAAEVTVR
jgi:hypothetical protein